MTRWGSLAAVLGLLFCSSAARAQVYTGSISGRVTDQTGAVLPGVAVTITSDRLQQPQTEVTADSGAYRFTELPIGKYRVALELTGFQKIVREGVLVAAGQSAQVNVQLALGQVAETVTVSGESPTMDVRQTSIPESFGRDRLENIPTARDPWVILEQTQAWS